MGGGWKGLGGAFVRLKVLLLKEPNMAPRAPMLFLFSVLTTFKVCVGAHKEMPPVHPPPPPPTHRTPPTHTHLHENGALFLRLLWRHFQIHRSVSMVSFEGGDPFWPERLRASQDGRTLMKQPWQFAEAETKLHKSSFNM